MTVLDAYVVLALLKAEPAADEAKELVEEGGCAMTPLGVAEVVDHLVRVVGTPEEEAVLDIAQLGLADPVAVDGHVTLAAGLLRARNHHHRDRAVSLADCVAAAVAGSQGGALATSDAHLLDLCHVEGIAVHPLPDSHGRIWAPRR